MTTKILKGGKKYFRKPKKFLFKKAQTGISYCILVSVFEVIEELSSKFFTSSKEHHNNQKIMSFKIMSFQIMSF